VPGVSVESNSCSHSVGCARAPTGGAHDREGEANASMTEENNTEKQDSETPEVYVAAGVVSDGPETGAIVSNTKIKARDLTAAHVGKFLGFYDKGVNFPVKIRRVQHFEGGKAPGVSVWMQVPKLPDGTPARVERMHVQFDHELELNDMMTY
jgi:hypothetical protein